MMWYELIVNGDLPKERSNHTCNYYDKKDMYFFYFKPTFIKDGNFWWRRLK